MRAGFENKLMKDGQKVFDAVVAKAIEGDMTAAKLIMDRILPTQKAIDIETLEKSKGVQISINVGKMENRPGEEAIEASFEDIT
jgi:hypothetical protein